MKWDVDENEPDLDYDSKRRRQYIVTCDGRPVREFVAFDTEEGWVRAACLIDHTERGPKPHPDPQDPMDQCFIRFEGDVKVWGPNGRLITGGLE